MSRTATLKRKIPAQLIKLHRGEGLTDIEEIIASEKKLHELTVQAVKRALDNPRVSYIGVVKPKKPKISPENIEELIRFLADETEDPFIGHLKEINNEQFKEAAAQPLQHLETLNPERQHALTKEESECAAFLYEALTTGIDD